VFINSWHVYGAMDNVCARDNHMHRATL